MDTLSAKGSDYLQRARGLGPAIDAAVDDIDRLRDMPASLFAALREQGLFRLMQPEDYSGAELDPPSLILVIEEIASHDASAAWCVGQTNICALTAAYLAPEVVKDIFGPDTGILAWGPGPGEAKVVPGGYRVSGSFQFASGSRLATWLGCHVPVIEADGSKRFGMDGKPLSATMFFRKESAAVTDTWHTMGLRGTGSDSYTVKDLFVPEAYTMKRDGSANPRVNGELYAFTPSTLYAGSFAGIALGIARSVMTSFVREAAGSIPRGGSRARSENHVMQAHVGWNEARLRAARAYLLTAVADVWAEARTRGHLTQDELLSIRLASTFAIQSAKQVVATLYEAAGAMAIFNDRPFERRFRDIHTVTQQIQGHPEHFETAGQVLLGRKPDRPLFTF